MATEPTSTVQSVIFVIGGVALWIQNHYSKKESKKVNKSITENNGGSSVKDRLDSFDNRLGNVEDDVKDTARRTERIEDILMGRHPAAKKTSRHD